MTSPGHINAYFSRVFGELWLAGSLPSARGQAKRLHVYNVYENQLDEVHDLPDSKTPLFEGFYLNERYKDSLSVKIDVETSRVLEDAEQLFSSLEDDVTMHLRTILQQLSAHGPSPPSASATETITTPYTPNPEITSATLSLASWAKVRRFLVFLRFRNSAGYSSIVDKLSSGLEHREEDGNIYPAYKTFVVQMQRRYVLRAFIYFLQGNDRRESQRKYDHVPSSGASGAEDKFVDFFHEVMDTYCWRMLEAEMCLGVVKEERESGREEYIISETCYGSLDEGFEEDPESCDFFFPFNPSVSLYLLGTSPADPLSPLLNATHTMFSVPVGLEGMIDVHMRNSMILQTYPNHLVFSSLKCIVCSLKSYDEFRWINEHQDYSRLRMRCRQKYSKEQLVKTLVLRDRGDGSGDGAISDSEPESEDELENRREAERRRERSDSGTRKKGVRVFDLTDEVRLEGTWAVGFGTFSDVWKGRWRDPMEKRERAVAVKFLRSVMVQNVKERLIRRIQGEVSTWHKLCHRNVSQFFGIVQSESSFGMVSPWYTNGTICEYLKVVPDVDRLKLLIQIASGVHHLHDHSPPIVHGDLKGGNILIDVHGHAIITDFGLSKVMEEVSQACSDETNSPPGTGCGGKGTSVFAGSTRWMAPELIMALVEDDDPLEGDEVSDGDTPTRPKRGPVITTMSDVYAFAAVCLEVATDELPYGHRSNDHAVILDILRSISPRPRRSQSKCRINVSSVGDFWGLLDRCWAMPAERRPVMLECLRELEQMSPTANTSIAALTSSNIGQHRKRSN